MRPRGGVLIPFPTRGGLGAVPVLPLPSPAQAFASNSQAAWSKYCTGTAGSGSCGGGSTYGAFVWQAIQARLLPAPSQANASTDCTGVQTTPGILTGGRIASAAGGTAASLAAIPALAATPIPIVGIFVALGGIIASLFGAHHAQAVAAQASAICSAVPSANSLLQQIDQALASGQLTKSQAAQLYTQLGTQFSTAMKSGTSYKHGDALWGFDQGLQAVLYARNADLNSGVLTSGAAAPWTQPAPTAAAASGSTGSTGSSSGSLVSAGAVSTLPSWLPWAAIAGGAALLLAA